ncbi:exonuclease SbcCD subunit D [Marinibaculum pumilum]|uniref:Exonuclease SbcCD subunit D n=1 Tax=Marinibaculum pumilum TaxID=1766165 RepID=A0ABV7KWP6_9PROT
MAFRFLHTADIHLDSPLRGLAGQQGAAADRIRTATRAAFDALVGRAVEEAVDFVVIAGDLYDGDWRDYQTGLFFVAQMGRLAQARIPVFLALGNHDAQNRITRSLTLPDNVTVFPAKAAASAELPEIGAVLHGRSFRQRDETEDFVPGYPEPVAGAFNIGVLHTGLGGRGGHADYAPCSLPELVAKGYDYWALGHVHQAEVLHEAPHVVFPGNLQGRHVRETGPKGATLVTVADGAVTGLTRWEVDVVRWALLPVDAAGCDRMTEVEARIRDAIEAAAGRDAGTNGDRLLAIRIELQGATALHAALAGAAERLLAEARAAAAGLGDGIAWVEKVKPATAPPPDAAAQAARQDALGDLQRMLDAAAADPDLAARLDAEVGEMARRLPAELRAEAEDPALQAALEGDTAALVAEARRLLDASLADDLPESLPDTLSGSGS